MAAYYNEIDPNAAEWLRQLIKSGQIAPGDVDERSIEDVTPDELRTYTQCHFFAGVGVWSHALRLAGWEDDRPCWTGSAPCQPFSAAGKGGGVDDERHLWPAMFWLIQQCRPETVFGEQVASKDGLGWWDIVSADLEGSGYACGANDLCAAGIGAPHIRQRLYWVANSDGAGRQRQGQAQSAGRGNHALSVGGGQVGTMADSSSERRQQDPRGPLGDETAHGGERWHRGKPDADYQPSGNGQNGRGLGDPISTGLPITPSDRGTSSEASGEAQRQTVKRTDSRIIRHWANPEWLYCRDGKARPTQPGIFPLVDGSAPRVGCGSDISLQESQNTAEGRVMRLKGYGNAIVGPLAAEFIGAAMEVLS